MKNFIEKLLEFLKEIFQKVSKLLEGIISEVKEKPIEEEEPVEEEKL